MESGLSDFLRQIPAPLIGMSCLSVIVLTVVITYILWSRSKKRQETVAVAAGSSAEFYTPPAAAAEMEPLLHDLPDLDVLTSTPPVPVPIPEPPAPPPKGMQRVQLSEGDAIDAVEVLTILRDVVEGGLLVQIGDKVYRNPPASADVEFKRRFNLTMKELATGRRAAPETPAAPAVIPSAAAPVESTPLAPVPPVTATGETPAVYVPPVIPPTVSLPGDLPKFRMPDKIEVPPRRGRKAPPKEVIPEINIAAAIESYLQHKLALTPAYAGRSIHVRSAAHGGVEIDVDGRLYEAVGDIEDAGVRSFMASTIEEWQSRQ